MTEPIPKACLHHAKNWQHVKNESKPLARYIAGDGSLVQVGETIYYGVYKCTKCGRRKNGPMQITND